MGVVSGDGMRLKARNDRPRLPGTYPPPLPWVRQNIYRVFAGGSARNLHGPAWACDEKRQVGDNLRRGSDNLRHLSKRRAWGSGESGE